MVKNNSKPRASKNSNFIGLTFKSYHWINEQSLFGIESCSASLLKTEMEDYEKKYSRLEKDLK